MNELTRRHMPGGFAGISGATACIVGGLVLAGWSLDIPALTSVVAGWPQMVVPTAVAFVLCGVGLVCAAWRARAESVRRTESPLARFAEIAAIVLPAGAAAIGLLRLGEIVTGLDLGIERSVMAGARVVVDAAEAPHMSLANAVCLLLIGAAFPFARNSRPIGIHQALCFPVLLIAWLSLGRYLFSGEPLAAYAHMSFPTAALFLLLAAAVLSLRRDGGVAALLTGRTQGGKLARRLLLPALVLPFAIGWLRLKGQQAGWYGLETGLLLYSTANAVVIGALVWINSIFLHRSDTARTLADHRTEAQLERLNLLHQITRAIGERQDLKSIFQVAIQSLEQHLSVDFGCVCLLDRKDRALVVTSVGSRSEALALALALPERARFPIDANGLARCVSGELVYEPDIAGLDFPFPRRLAGSGLHSLIAAPLRVESEVFGVLIVTRRQPKSFSSGECEFLRQLSEHVALASHQAQLYAMLQRAYDDLRETQQAAVQHERLRALGQMASGIAHNINNAIAPVTLYTESLLEKEPDLSPRAREYLTTIQRAIEDVVHTVAQMREFYRQAEPELRPAPVNLNRIIEQAIDLTRARWSDMAQRQGVDIHVEATTAPELPDILGNAIEIREAVINLIINAVDAMPDGGRLAVRAGMADGRPGMPKSPARRRVHVEVRDTGSGMDETTRSRCLEPFFTTKGERGTGLGLATVHGVVQRHGAELEIDSRPGSGTVIRLVFPVPAVPVSSPLAPAVTVRMPGRQRILIVDDDPVLLNSLRNVLSSDGHDVVAVNGGQAGIETFCSERARGEGFTVVITDLGMPQVDGRRVAAAIKSESPGTPVILLTGWGLQLAVSGELSAPVDRILSKPPKLDELRSALAECCAAGT